MELKPFWLIRFRFAVILGQSLILLAAWILKSHQVSIIPILLILAAEVTTNIALIPVCDLSAHSLREQAAPLLIAWSAPGQLPMDSANTIIGATTAGSHNGKLFPGPIHPLVWYN